MRPQISGMALALLAIACREAAPPTAPQSTRESDSVRQINAATAVAVDALVEFWGNPAVASLVVLGGRFGLGGQIFDQALGTTFAYDVASASYRPDPGMEGTPRDAVRLLLYAVVPSDPPTGTGTVIVPLRTVGYLDLRRAPGGGDTTLALTATDLAGTVLAEYMTSGAALTDPYPVSRHAGGGAVLLSDGAAEWSDAGASSGTFSPLPSFSFSSSFAIRRADGSEISISTATSSFSRILSAAGRLRIRLPSTGGPDDGTLVALEFEGRLLCQAISKISINGSVIAEGAAFPAAGDALAQALGTFWTALNPCDGSLRSALYKVSAGLLAPALAALEPTAGGGVISR